MQVAIKPLTDAGEIQYGLFFGLVSNASGCDRCESDGYSAVVQINGHGMVCSLIHPSRVVFDFRESR